jgi:hypothetical protein
VVYGLDPVSLVTPALSLYSSNRLFECRKAVSVILCLGRFTRISFARSTKRQKSPEQGEREEGYENENVSHPARRVDRVDPGMASLASDLRGQRPEKQNGRCRCDHQEENDKECNVIKHNVNPYWA